MRPSGATAPDNLGRVHEVLAIAGIQEPVALPEVGKFVQEPFECQPVNRAIGVDASVLNEDGAGFSDRLRPFDRSPKALFQSTIDPQEALLGLVSPVVAQRGHVAIRSLDETVPIVLRGARRGNAVEPERHRSVLGHAFSNPSYLVSGTYRSRSVATMADP